MTQYWFAIVAYNCKKIDFKLAFEVKSSFSLLCID